MLSVITENYHFNENKWAVLKNHIHRQENTQNKKNLLLYMYNKKLNLENKLKGGKGMRQPYRVFNIKD